MLVKKMLDVKGHDVATIDQGRTMADAIRELRQRGIGAVVVTGDQAPLVGILSERDVVRAVAGYGAGALTMTVQEFMSKEVTTCGVNTTVDQLMAMMTNQRIRHVPVVEEGRLEGMISIGDVVKSRLEELERDKVELLDYVLGR